MTSLKATPAALTLALAAISPLHAQDILVPCLAIPNAAPGDTIDLATGVKRAALLKTTKMVDLEGGDRSSQSAEIVFQHIQDQSQVSGASTYSASLSARAGFFKANFQISGSAMQSTTRTSEYVVVSATWRQSARIVERNSREQVANLIPEQLGSHVVTGLQYGGQLKIVIEMLGATSRQAESFKSSLSASGFGAKGNVSVDQLVASSGFTGSLSLYFMQNGGPVFTPPSLATISQQVFDWANQVHVNPTPINLVVEDTANFLSQKDRVAWETRSKLLREYSRAAGELVRILESCTTDRATIESISRSRHRYDTEEWLRWQKADMNQQLTSTEVTYASALAEMAAISDALAAGQAPKLSMPTYVPPQLPQALDGPGTPSEMDALRSEIDELKRTLAASEQRTRGLSDSVYKRLEAMDARVSWVVLSIDRIMHCLGHLHSTLSGEGATAMFNQAKAAATNLVKAGGAGIGYFQVPSDNR
ncbi:MAG: hypothetical protein R3F56_11905 [Planctomycetota bacterium]